MPSSLTTLLSQTTMTKDEYAFLSDTWSGKDGKAYSSVGEDCYENGWIDDFGLLTPVGEAHLMMYMQKEGIRYE